MTRGCKKEIGDPRGAWVRGQKRTRVRFVFLIFFYGVSELPSPRNAQKREKTKQRNTIGFDFLIFFDTIFLQNVFCGVFELSSLRNTRKRDKTKKNRGKTAIENFVDFLEKAFDMDVFSKIFVWCFWTPLTEKRPKTY
jgi:hypothetical protein